MPVQTRLKCTAIGVPDEDDEIMLTFEEAHDQTGSKDPKHYPFCTVRLDAVAVLGEFGVGQEYLLSFTPA